MMTMDPGRRWAPATLALLGAAWGCLEGASPPDAADLTYTAPGESAVSTAGGEPAAAAPTSKAPLVAATATYAADTLTTAKSWFIAAVSAIDPTICLDVPYGKAAAGAVPHAYTCLGPAGGQQTWVLDRGQWIIGDGFCLALAPGQSLGAAPVLAACLGDPAAARAGSQLWAYDRGTLSLLGSSLCLGLSQDTAIVNTPLRLDPCDPANALQQWALANSATPVDTKAPLVGLVAYLRRASASCIDILNGATADGTSVGIYDCNDLGAQRLVLQGTQVRYQDRCISIVGETAAVGTKIELQACRSGAVSQAWLLRDGTLRLVDSSPPLCMCVTGDAPKSKLAMPLQLAACEVASAPNPDCVWSLGKR